jgi:hypothetical protein
MQWIVSSAICYESGVQKQKIPGFTGFGARARDLGHEISASPPKIILAKESTHIAIAGWLLLHPAHQRFASQPARLCALGRRRIRLYGERVRQGLLQLVVSMTTHVGGPKKVVLCDPIPALERRNCCIDQMMKQLVAVKYSGRNLKSLLDLMSGGNQSLSGQGFDSASRQKDSPILFGIPFHPSDRVGVPRRRIEGQEVRARTVSIRNVRCR